MYRWYKIIKVIRRDKIKNINIFLKIKIYFIIVSIRINLFRYFNYRNYRFDGNLYVNKIYTLIYMLEISLLYSPRFR